MPDNTLEPMLERNIFETKLMIFTEQHSGTYLPDASIEVVIGQNA